MGPEDCVQVVQLESKSFYLQSYVDTPTAFCLFGWFCGLLSPCAILSPLPFTAQVFSPNT